MNCKIVCAFALVYSAADAAGRNGRIAFVNGADVYTVASDGSDIRQLTRLERGAFAELPSWEPSDEHIVYTVRRADGSRQLWIMQNNGKHQHRLLDDRGYGNTAGAFSPDGQFVAFSRCDPGGDCAIYEVHIEDGALRAITNLNAGYVDSVPAYSIEGTRIAFERYDFKETFTVMVVDRDGKHLRAVTGPRVRARHPTWSVDGIHIVFSCDCDASGHFRIWSADRDGEGLAAIIPLRTARGSSQVPDHLSPSWSPDENFLAIEERSLRSEGRIAIVNITGNPSERLIKELIPGKQPSWSQAP